MVNNKVVNNKVVNNKKDIFDKYKKYLYSYNKLNMTHKSDILFNQVPVNTELGRIELFVFTERGRVPVEDALVTIYARQGEINAEPVKTIMTENRPILIELPVAHPSGTLIQGPEYYFTTYNLTIEKEGYYSITVLNIRIFPGITAQFSYNLNPILPGVPGRQETIAIPTHPRDIIDGQKVIFKSSI